VSLFFFLGTVLHRLYTGSVNDESDDDHPPHNPEFSFGMIRLSRQASDAFASLSAAPGFARIVAEAGKVMQANLGGIGFAAHVKMLNAASPLLEHHARVERLLTRQMEDATKAQFTKLASVFGASVSAGMWRQIEGATGKQLSAGIIDSINAVGKSFNIAGIFPAHVKLTASLSLRPVPRAGAELDATSRAERPSVALLFAELRTLQAKVDRIEGNQGLQQRESAEDRQAGDARHYRMVAFTVFMFVLGFILDSVIQHYGPLWPPPSPPPDKTQLESPAPPTLDDVLVRVGIRGDLRPPAGL
jgi:hypothetical protein